MQNILALICGDIAQNNIPKHIKLKVICLLKASFPSRFFTVLLTYVLLKTDAKINQEQQADITI